MNNAEVIRALADLGIDEQSVRVLPLLPLIQVAWADGEIQAGERTLIETLAVERFELNDEGHRVLGNWMRYPPTPSYLERGRLALLAVAQSDDSGLDADDLPDVVALAKKVARSAGGLFGIGSISRSEAEALDEIAKALKIPEGAGIDEAMKGALPQNFEKKNRVTITFSTSALDLSPMGGVLELEGHSDKIPVDRNGLAVGSDDAADIRVEYDPSVSPMHARVFERDRKFYVADLDSESGTWVNGERIVERRLLGGETIQVGSEASFTFKLLRRIPKQMI
jgi:hypothetical protein